MAFKFAGLPDIIVLTDYEPSIRPPTNYTVVYFRFFNNDVKWAEAVNLCDDEHSSLASLGSPEEETSVRSMLAKDEGTEAWIGLSDRVHLDNKDLIWVDGNPMPYSNWNSYQDDVIEGRKCATLSIATEGWMYKACQETFGFICKKRLKGEQNFGRLT